MEIDADNQREKPKEAFFENALKRASYQAFDALLTCGVRDLAGLFSLTADELRQFGISSRIISELISIQRQLSEQLESDRQNKKNVVIDSFAKKQKESINDGTPSNKSVSKSATPIPSDLMRRLSTRAYNVIIRENLTCEQILKYQEKDLFKLKVVGKKTVNDIRRLQNEIVQIYPELRKLTQTEHHEGPKFHKGSSVSNLDARSSQCVENCTPDSKSWSLLSRTLQDIFQVTPPGCDQPIDDKKITISNLGIPPADIDQLRMISIFPEDSADILLSITTGYLLQVKISDDALSIILNYLSYITGHTDPSQMVMPTESISCNAIYADIQTSLFEKFRVPDFSYPDLIAQNDDRITDTAIIWRDILKISEYSIVELLGFTVQGLNAIKYFWKLREQALKLQNIVFKGLPAEAFCEFEQLVDAFLQMAVKKERDSEILKKRLGLLDGREWTLEESGQCDNLTRERIRQIEKQWMPLLKKPKKLEKLGLLWLAVDEILTTMGGVCCVQEIAESLKDLWKWKTLPPDKALASLISLSANYEVVWEVPIRVIMPNHQCVNCTKIWPVPITAVENQTSGTLSFAAAVAIMKKFCQDQACEKSSELVKFSDGYIHFLDDAIEEILADENTIYTQYAWGVKYGMRRTKLVEQIILNTGKAMHFKEVRAEANKDRPAHGQISDRSIYTYLDRSPALLLWGPGTYIHKDMVTIPVSLISEIENDIILRLNPHNIPYLSITGIFERYKNRLMAEGIPNAQALYSCMRIINHQYIDCADYPYVLRRESGGQRLPIPLVLEEFILEQDNAVSLDQIKSFGVQKLCMSESNLMMALHSIPNLLRINRYKYIHLNQFGIKKDQLRIIVEHLRKLLEKHDHISASLLFDEKKISCKLLGISTPMLLFSLIQLFYSDQFDLLRYPQIRVSGVDADNKRNSGVALNVANYIREKAIPCSYAELYRHFVDELGYKQYRINNSFYTNNKILRYSEGVVIHLETLGWTENKRVATEKLATIHLDNRKSAGIPFGLISDIYEYMHDKLPGVPEHIPWTPTLLGELLCTGGKYRIIGTSRNAFVSIPNSYGIETLDDLLYYILNTQYDGAANIDLFISDMREVGILKRGLTSIMLGGDSRVIIDGNVVKLAGLSDRVK